MIKRKICFVINSRANYARIKSTMKECLNYETMDIYIVVGASGLLYNYGKVDEIIEFDGFNIDYRVYSAVSGDNPELMAKTTGLAIIELSMVFAKIKPDFVVSVADRYETLGTVIAASYMNIPVVHTQGGEISGSIDESVRHACTKLSHLHFPATKKAANIIKQMGENPDSIFVTGCPAIDLVESTPLVPIEKIFSKYSGVGAKLDFTNPYLLVPQHPVTTKHFEARNQIDETLKAIIKLDLQTIWLWPNIDSGSDSISKFLREFREKNISSKIHFYRNFSAEDYVNVMKNASCIVGNSSSGIREASYMGLPSVVIGDRQSGRECADNVMFSNYNSEDISNKILRQLKQIKYNKSTLYGDGNAGYKMAQILNSSVASIEKKFFDINVK